MSDKPKVYQGVRVKATVRELLQKRRALQAMKTATTNQCLLSQETCYAPLPDVESGNSITVNSVQPQYYDVCNDQMETCEFNDQALIDMILQAEDFTNSNFPPVSQSLPWSHEQLPSYTENNFQNWAPSSGSDSLILPSPDENTYSPPQCYASFPSSLCYSNPTQMDASHDLPPGSFDYSPCSLQQCYSSNHWASSLESGKSLEYTTCSTSDWWHNSTVDESYFRANATSPEMYYLPFSTQSGVQ